MRDSGKPAVGHNLAFDLSYSLHSYAQVAPLPCPRFPAACLPPRLPRLLVRRLRSQAAPYSRRAGRALPQPRLPYPLASSPHLPPTRHHPCRSCREAGRSTSSWWGAGSRGASTTPSFFPVSEVAGQAACLGHGWLLRHSPVASTMCLHLLGPTPLSQPGWTFSLLRAPVEPAPACCLLCRPVAGCVFRHQPGLHP